MGLEATPVRVDHEIDGWSWYGDDPPVFVHGSAGRSSKLQG
jgi:hypothetical protein